MNSSPAPSFARRPQNDFPEFIARYFRQCQAAHGFIEGSAGKWTPEDLIPGLSDFDTRFFVRDDATCQDWSAISMAVGRVHLEMARECKHWARNLEHLPGVNLTWSELLDPANYYTEFAQWTLYHGRPEKLQQARDLFDGRPWSCDDERYHWKRLASYYGRYDRKIDPPINLGSFENKYPLHSRLLHYFAPPLHSAVCLLQRKTTPGKLDAFRRAHGLFPHPETIEEVLRLIEGHYEFPEFLQEPGMTHLEGWLETYLKDAVNLLVEEAAPFACPRNPTPQELRKAVSTILPEPGLEGIFENARLARLMKGRLWFYVQKPSWFDSAPLIRIELNRIRSSFLEKPWQIFARMADAGELEIDNAIELTLRTGIISAEEASACRRFAELADPQTPDGDLFSRAAALVEVYDEFLGGLENLSKAARSAIAACA